MAAGLSIVVVEDHDDLRDVTVEALSGLGHRVRGVGCAEAVDGALDAIHTDLLVLDLNLPGEDGFSLARRLRISRPEIGIVMVTVREQLPDKIAGYRSGADIYLTKPTSFEELAAAINALSRRLLPSTTAGPPEAARGAPGEPAVLEAGYTSSANWARGARVQELHEYLTRLEGKLPPLSVLARRFGLSARRLNAAFAREYGQPIHAFVTARRLDTAFAEIRDTDVALKELAARLGFAHVQHFSRAFRKKFGVPPGHLRRRTDAE